MEGRVVPYLKEVGLVGNIPSQLQGMYVRILLHAHIRTPVLYSTPLRLRA